MTEIRTSSYQNPASWKINWIPAGVCSLALLLLFTVLYHYGMHGGFVRSDIWQEMRRWLWISKQLFLAPYPYFLIVVAVILENVRPVERDIKTFLPAITQDFIWFLSDAVFQATLIPLYAGFLKTIYNRYFDFLTITSIQSLPPALKFLTALLIFDFSQWLHHFIRHKVTYFWYFHTIHHSSRGVNLFTDLRIHPVEYLISRAMVFIPLFMFKADPLTITSVALFMRWYTHVYHANLKTNYGFLKYFMVTPQSHRIHHSREPQHRDRNFGVMFSIWDRIFGTLYKNYEEYPQTGIQDPDFPLEQKPFLFLWTYVRQMLYPFKKIFLVPVPSGRGTSAPV